MNRDLFDFEVARASFAVRNRGPWVTLEYDFLEGLSCGQTTALGDGSGCGFKEPSLRDNFFAYFPGVNYHQPRQVHGAELEFVRKPASACYPATDGLVSELTSTALTVLTADCLPVFIVETPVRPDSRFALVHAGWRGLEKNIVGRVIEEYFAGCALQVVVGAHIHQNSYRVDDEVVGKFSRRLNYSRGKLEEMGIVSGDDKLDLFGILGLLLSEVPAEVRSVHRLDMDTAGNDLIPLISYRQDNTDQRMLNWIFKEE